MKKIADLLFILLAISLAFGSFNPLELNMAGSISEQVEEQRGFTPILFGLCMMVSLLDSNVHVYLKKFIKYYKPLIFLLFFYILSSVIFNISTVDKYTIYFIKLFVAFTGFYAFSVYFYVHPDTLRKVCLFFSFTCGVISVAFFLGLLDGFYFFSNGRLWMFGENPNTYSFVQGFGALVLSHEICRDTKIMYKGLCGIFVLIIILFTFLSGSRGTLAFLCISLVMIFYNYLKEHMTLMLFMTAIAFYVIFTFIANNSEELVIIERFIDLQSGDSREELIKNAMSLFYDSPIYGYGINGYEYMKLSVFNDIRDSHNMIVSILAVSGILGFFAIMTFLCRVYVLLRRIRKIDIYALSLFIYVLLISMKTGGIITYSIMWFIYAVIVSNAEIVKSNK